MNISFPHTDCENGCLQFHDMSSLLINNFLHYVYLKFMSVGLIHLFVILYTYKETNVNYSQI
jgi:hypothetical protein